MAGISPRKIGADIIKANLLRPALTSHFLCTFNPPSIPQIRNYYLGAGETFSLFCSEASLPGSSIMTNEINDDYMGVTERIGYRRQYDDRTDFTFYVDYGGNDKNYSVILFFEEWMRYATGDVTTSEMIPGGNFSYRVNFPEGTNGYRTEMFITKFEKDIQGKSLEYTFVGAFPISISSMPVSYDSSQLLKCTVSFTYSRYVVNKRVIEPQEQPRQSTATSVPSQTIIQTTFPPITTSEGDNNINTGLG